VPLRARFPIVRAQIARRNVPDELKKGPARSRIMYVERKAGSLTGDARVCPVDSASRRRYGVLSQCHGNGVLS